LVMWRGMTGWHMTQNQLYCNKLIYLILLVN
jgi:hypothetical protein